jgi:carboxypeptidase Q
MIRHCLFAAMVATAAPGIAHAQTSEPIDRAAIQKVREEGLQRSQVMEIASWLTDVFGPRTTGSAGIRAASEWAVKTMTGWGLANVRQEPWGTLGSRQLCSNQVSIAHAISPQPFEISATAPSCSPSVGWVRGEVVLLDTVASKASLEGFRGKLKGKFVFVTSDSQFAVNARRRSTAQLAAMATGEAQTQQTDTVQRPASPPRSRLQLDSATVAFLAQEGVLAVIGTSAPETRRVLPSLGFQADRYGRLYRTAAKGVPVTLGVAVEGMISDSTPSTNVFAEILGSDRKLKDEVVMLGAHLDAVSAATGATDNAAGSAIMMEAIRILKKVNLPLKRTVRLALWSGEEQGLKGSAAYVQKQFGGGRGTPATPDHAKFSVYFNLDNGTGAIRGVFLQDNKAVEPIFRAWMEPFKDLGMTTLTLTGTGGTDHLSFDRASLPGFQFIQDPIEYFDEKNRTHHTKIDTYERLMEEDLRKNATIVAAFVYLAANRPDKLPRKAQP